MKIYNQDPKGTSATETGRSEETPRIEGAGRQAVGAAASGGGDQVELSDRLNSLSRAMSSYNASRSAEVQAIMAQYQSGSYRVDSLTTSRSLVADALANADQ
jgi:anti-sigma28 factor (negative regulator of flagellin synthesis)